MRSRGWLVISLFGRYAKLLPLAMKWGRALEAMRAEQDRDALTHLRDYINGMDDLAIHPHASQRVHAYLLESFLSLRLGLTTRAFDALIDARDLLVLDILPEDETGYLASYAAALAQRLDRLADLNALNAVNPVLTRYAKFDVQKVPRSLRQTFQMDMGRERIWQHPETAEDQALD